MNITNLDTIISFTENKSNTVLTACFKDRKPKVLSAVVLAATESEKGGMVWIRDRTSRVILGFEVCREHYPATVVSKKDTPVTRALKHEFLMQFDDCDEFLIDSK